MSEICMMCDTEPCKCAEIYCSHIVRKGECVFCDERPHMVLSCAQCTVGDSGGQTWHVIEGAVAICRKCGTGKPFEVSDNDIGISNG